MRENERQSHPKPLKCLENLAWEGLNIEFKPTYTHYPNAIISVGGSKRWPGLKHHPQENLGWDLSLENLTCHKEKRKTHPHIVGLHH